MIHGLLFRTIHKIFQCVLCFLKFLSVDLRFPDRPPTQETLHAIAMIFSLLSSKTFTILNLWRCLRWSGSAFPSQNVFNVLWSLHFCCCHVDPVDGTYLVCCYIRTFNCQLKIKFFFTHKTMCSVTVWTFTSCRFCGKLCCCNQFVPKSFSLVGILLITWVFHPNSRLGWQILQQIMNWILACSSNTFQCF